MLNEIIKLNEKLAERAKHIHSVFCPIIQDYFFSDGDPYFNTSNVDKDKSQISFEVYHAGDIWEGGNDSQTFKYMLPMILAENGSDEELTIWIRAEVERERLDNQKQHLTRVVNCVRFNIDLVQLALDNAKAAIADGKNLDLWVDWEPVLNSTVDEYIKLHPDDEI